MAVRKDYDIFKITLKCIFKKSLKTGRSDILLKIEESILDTGLVGSILLSDAKTLVLNGLNTNFKII